MGRKIAVEELPTVTTGDPVTVGGKYGTKAVTLPSFQVEGSSEVYLTARNGVYRVCGMCENGFRPGYAHVFGGECFYCHGAGCSLYAENVETVQRKVRARVRREATIARKTAEKALQREAAREAWRVANADFLGRVKAFREARGLTFAYRDGGLATRDDLTRWESMARDESTLVGMLDGNGTLTAGQVQFAETLMARIEAREAEHAAKVATGRYAAPEGTKGVSVTGKIVTAMTLEGDYGSSKMIIVEGTGADQGVTAKWIGTADAIWSLDQGDTVTLTGTVKPKGGHSEYNGVPQTVMTRCKVTVHTA